LHVKLIKLGGEYFEVDYLERDIFLRPHEKVSYKYSCSNV